LVDHLVREAVPQLAWELDPGRRRAAGRLLRSPYGLAPHPAGATGPAGDLVSVGLRRHDAPFRSCLHRPSDTPFKRTAAIPGFTGGSYIEFLTPGVVVMLAMSSAWVGMVWVPL